MKKLMSLFAAVLFAGIVFAACNIPNGFVERQEVSVYTGKYMGSYMVYQASNACDSYGICYGGKWYYVSKSDKDGYGDMFWVDNQKHYFNM